MPCGLVPAYTGYSRWSSAELTSKHVTCSAQSLP